MAKFCSNCGKELNEDQDVCLGCGKVIPKESKPKNHSGYKTSTGIVMIILGVCLLSAAISSDSKEFLNTLLVYGLPGLCALISGILSLNSKKNPDLLVPSAIVMFIGATINFTGIIDISIFSIIAITFGILNIVLSKKEN